MLINANVALNNGLVSGGVQVEQIYEREDGIKTVYDPSHPDADEDPPWENCIYSWTFRVPFRFFHCRTEKSRCQFGIRMRF